MSDLHVVAGIIEAYGKANARHVGRTLDDACEVYDGDRCDITAAYLNAARMVIAFANRPPGDAS